MYACLYCNAVCSTLLVPACEQASAVPYPDVQQRKMCFASCQGAVKSCMTMHAQVNVHDPKLGIVQDSADKVIYCVQADFLATLTALQPDVCITAAYGKVLPKKFLDIPKRGTVNIHPSLLPKYRGAAPVQRALEVSSSCKPSASCALYLLVPFTVSVIAKAASCSPVVYYMSTPVVHYFLDRMGSQVHLSQGCTVCPQLVHCL